MPSRKRTNDSLRAALAELAASDAPALVDEARIAARTRARAMIEDVMVDELLRAAAGKAPDPDPPAEEPIRARSEAPAGLDGWWTYCVLGAEDATKLGAGIPGVESEAEVEVVREGRLAALVSRVPLTEYDDEHLREHLNDIDWVERTARAHEAVLDVALAAATIVPLRLCTIYKSIDGVRALLRDENGELRRSLAEVAGRTEWGLKLFVDRTRLLEVLASEDGDEDGDASEGAGYLARKQRTRDAARRADTVAARCAEQVHRSLEAAASLAQANPLQRPEAHGHDAEMLLNGAYLVEREREGALAEILLDLEQEWSRAGFEFELTGPWPPYNFVSTSAPVTP